jgi:hypothetical protein
MRIYLTVLFVLISSFAYRSQGQNIVGVFREVDMYNNVITYIEFKADSTAIVKKTNLKKTDTTERAFVAKGYWKLNKDTVILDFGNVLQDHRLYHGNEVPIIMFIKNNSALYSRRYENGKFVKDGLLKKAYKLVRLRPELFYEYNNLPD